MGDLDHPASAWGRRHKLFSFGAFADPYRYLFYSADPFPSLRLFKDMLRVTLERKDGETTALSACQTLVVSTATRVGMGNLVGVVAAISAGGAGAVFWMWVTALLGSTTAFIELRWLSFIRKRILFTAVTGEVLPTICINFSRKIKKQTRLVPSFCALCQYQA